MHRILAIPIAALATVAACSSEATTKANPSTTTPPASMITYEPAFASAPCPEEIAAVEGVRCGRLTVPERRGSEPGTAANDRVVRLFVTRLPARTEPEREPVVVLQGGPGNTPDLPSFVDHPLRDGHEVIIFDQRGTARSLPSLACPEMSEEQLAHLRLGEVAQHDGVFKIHRRRAE